MSADDAERMRERVDAVYRAESRRVLALQTGLAKVGALISSHDTLDTMPGGR